MRKIKSERLRKLESELSDLEQWLKLGLVPKKDIQKHKKEIKALQEKVVAEEERIKNLKETGDIEEFVTPKKSQTRGSYSDMPTLPDYEGGSSEVGVTDEETNEIPDTEVTTNGEEKNENTDIDKTYEDEESYFSDRARWKRSSGILDPDSDDW